jgi:hypothetical protein
MIGATAFYKAQFRKAHVFHGPADHADIAGALRLDQDNSNFIFAVHHHRKTFLFAV